MPENSWQHWKRGAYTILLVWLLVQLIWVFAQMTGPFYDEGIYISAGLRNLRGFGMSDGYLVWFAGSLLWPTIAGVGYTLGGLLVVRIIAVAMSFFALWGITHAVGSTFNWKTGFWTALLLSIAAPIWSLSHLGVYDVPAFFGVGVSIWALGRLINEQNRMYAALMGLGMAFAMIAKYPIALMWLPLVALTWELRPKGRIIDLMVMFITFAFVVLSAYLGVRYQVAYWLEWSSGNKPTFGATSMHIVVAQIWFVAPWLILGVVAFWRKWQRSNLFIISLGAALLWPAYHIISGNPVSDWKHFAFGLVFLIPWVAYLLAQSRWVVRIAIIAVMTVYGLWQGSLFETAWTDTRPVTTFLVENITQNDDVILAGNSWSYMPALLRYDRVESPWVVFDNYRITHNELEGSLCQAEWIIAERGGSYPLPEVVERAIELCGYIEVFSDVSTMRWMDTNLSFHTKTVTTTIYQSPE